VNIGQAARASGISAKMIRDYEQIGQLISLRREPHRASRNVRALALGHVAEIEEKLREMAAMKDTLERLVAACHGNEQPDCAILDGLAEDGDAGADRLPVARPARREAPVRRRLSAR
jgi:DNA-binding transcriptional MerR regulator